MEDLHAHIEELVAEEHRLWQLESDGAAAALTASASSRSRSSSTATRDLLRRRRAVAAAGRDEEGVGLRSETTVESYLQSMTELPACTHLDRIQVTELPASIAGCEECLKMGSPGCTSGCARPAARSAAATRRRTSMRAAHARDDGHPIARSAEPGEDWSWCYVDEIAFEIAAG